MSPTVPVTAETVLTATAPPPVTEVVAEDADVALPWHMPLGMRIKKMLEQRTMMVVVVEAEVTVTVALPVWLGDSPKV